MSISVILLIVALILFGAAALGTQFGKINFIAGGLFFMVLAQLVVAV